MYYLAEYRGHARPGRRVGQQHVDGREPRRIYGVETYEIPVGFKFIGPKMIETGAMLGAEESGGFGFGMHLPERDGIYADLCLLDLFLRERERGRSPVSRAMEAFHELAGPSFYRRIDVHVDRPSYDAVKQRVLVGLRESPPTDVGGEPIARTQWLDTATASSGSSPTDRGCSCGRAGPSRSSASTRRRPRPPCATSSSSPGEQLVRGG